MDRINVLVTSVGGFSHGSSIVKALLVSKLNMRIYGVDASPKMLMASSLEEKVVVPYASDQSYFKCIKDIILKKSINCMFTGSEQELLYWAENKDMLENECNVKVFLNTKDVINLCKNKYNCSKKLEQLGFAVPETVYIDCVEACSAINRFPVIIKPNIESGASKNIFFAQDEDELLFISKYLMKNNVKIIIQQYIPFYNNEYTVGVTSDLETGKVYNSIVLHKFFEGPTRGMDFNSLVISSGITQGSFIEKGFVNQICERIAKDIHSQGPLNIQVRVHDNKVYPFEINPRFSGTTSARAYNGYNEPEFYIRKNILNDSKSYESLETRKTGFIVKGLDEIYVG